MAGLYALAAAFFASFSVVYVLVCTFTPFLGCSCPISISLAASSILYNILQLYHQEGSGVATLRLGLRVVIGPR
jgi:hypothetical protein